MNAEEKRKQLEWDILAIIERKLQTGEMDAKRAREIAKMVLAKLHPPLTLEELYEIVPTLDDYFTELSQAVIPFLNEYDAHKRQEVAQQAEQLVKEGKIDESLHLLKQTTDHT